MLLIQLHSVSKLICFMYLKMNLMVSISTQLISITDRTYLRDTDQEETSSFLPLDVSTINVQLNAVSEID